MFVNLIYNKLNTEQKKVIINFIISNFNNYEQLIIKEKQIINEEQIINDDQIIKDKQDIIKKLKIVTQKLNPSELILEPNTIIIINIENNNITSCVCFLNNNLLKKKLTVLNISENSFNIKTNKKGILLYNFCVDKKYRGKQYGTKLIEYSIDFLKKLNIDYIHCQAENDISKKIFLKNNFIINNTFKNITLMTCLL